MKYIKTFEENNNLKIGDYIRIKNSSIIYKIANTTKVKNRPYFVVDIDDKRKPEMPLLKDIIPLPADEASKLKYNL